MQELATQLTRDESNRQFPYDDKTGHAPILARYNESGQLVPTGGKLTIGVGCNLTDNGLSDKIRRAILMEQIYEVMNQLDDHFPWWNQLDDARMGVLANMCFNLGVERLSEFHKFLGAMQNHDWETAASEMVNSVWAKQVGARAARLEVQMKSGVWQ